MTELSQDHSLSLPDLGLRPRNLRLNRLLTYMDDRIGACGAAVLNEGAYLLRMCVPPATG